MGGLGAILGPLVIQVQDDRPSLVESLLGQNHGGQPGIDGPETVLVSRCCTSDALCLDLLPRPSHPGDTIQGWVSPSPQYLSLWFAFPTGSVTHSLGQVARFEDHCGALASKGEHVARLENYRGALTKARIVHRDLPCLCLDLAPLDVLRGHVSLLSVLGLPSCLGG
jgi:hypothetical protein